MGENENNKQKKTRKKMKHKKGRKIEKQIIITQQIEAKLVISSHANGLNNSHKKFDYQTVFKKQNSITCC